MKMTGKVKVSFCGHKCCPIAPKKVIKRIVKRKEEREWRKNEVHTHEAQ